MLSTIAVGVSLLWACFMSQTQSNEGKHVLLTEYAEKYGAACLDGSPPAFYFLNGNQSDSYFLWFQGGNNNHIIFFV